MARFPRIEAALGGAALHAVSAKTLQVLVEGQVREDSEIEFKSELYGNSEADRRALATEVAALANATGGVIFLGVKEEAGVAVDLTPVSMDETEEIRMRQVIASLTAPSPELEIVRVEASDPDQGFYLLVVPASPMAAPRRPSQ